MVKYVLKVKAELEGAEALQMPDSWCMTVQQSAGEEKRGPVFVSKDEEHELNGSRGTANFVIKFPGDKKQAYMSIIDDKKMKTKNAIAGDDQDYVAVACFECRGLDPVEWHPGTGFKFIASDSGTKFEDVDLTPGDWYDYDEQGDQSVGLSSIEYKIERF